MSGLNDLISGYDALLLTSGDNTFYATGYRSSFCYVLISPAVNYFVTDKRYALEARQHLKDFEVIDGDVNVLSGLLKRLGARRIGVDEEIPHRDYRLLEAALSDFEISDISTRLLTARSVKTAEEIALVRKAQKITDKAYSEILGYLKEGVSEREIAARLEFIMKTEGAEREAFDTIVAFGDNTAKPHAHPTERKLAKNQPVLMDFGAKYEGYCSDMTRTVFYGVPSERFAEIYKSVLCANTEAEKQVFSGNIALNADKAARDALKKADLERFFTHSTGHGVGVAIHEQPNLSKTGDLILRDNMIVTVEPGVYIDNEFGIRIEDLLLVGAKSEILTESDKKLRIIN